ncbi:aldehyde dehydrogenase family protein [Streptomyces sp. NPDC093591]|uniref:aldehyde dehydrogenase family protein n=1 Tax=Streptomyces sp. NPDC093591 TaxID=3366044 RepID=UPI0037F69F80
MKLARLAQNPELPHDLRPQRHPHRARHPLCVPSPTPCRANGVPVGLAACVWTESARRSHAVAARLDSGTVWVNSHLVLANEVPWGGFKGSGYGRDLSLYALVDYSRTKHVMHNHGR